MQNAPVGALSLRKNYALDQTTILEIPIKLLNCYGPTGTRGMNHAATADINAHMATIRGHQQVARSRIRDRYTH